MARKTLRGTVFWGVDALKGKTIKQHYQHIKQIMESNTSNNKQLLSICSHACNTVPFYNSFKSSNFNDLPVVTKNIIKKCIHPFNLKYI